MELQSGLSGGTIVTFAAGRLSERARIVLAEVHDGQCLVLTDRTPFHPQSLTWPDQPGDRGTLALPDGRIAAVGNSCEGLLNGETGELFTGEAALGMRRGEATLQAVVVHVLTGDLVPAAGDEVTLTVDQPYRDALSLQHTGVHLAALALNQCAAAFWTKDQTDRDSLGAANLDKAAVTRSQIAPDGSTDSYRLGKSLRKKGFDRDAFLSDLPARAAAINATLRHMLAAPAPVVLSPAEGPLGDRRRWSTRLNGTEVSMPCGGTHVADLSQIGGISVQLAPIEEGFVMLTQTAPA